MENGWGALEKNMWIKARWNMTIPSSLGTKTMWLSGLSLGSVLAVVKSSKCYFDLLKQACWGSLHEDGFGIQKENMFRVENHMKLIQNHHLQRDILKSCQLSMVSICLIIPGATFSKRNGLSTPTWWIGFLQGGHSWMLVFHVTINLPKQIQNIYTIYITISYIYIYQFQVRDPSVYRYKSYHVI